MSDTVIILGAGASVGAGAPLMTGFFDRAKALLKYEDTLVDHEAPRRIVEPVLAGRCCLKRAGTGGAIRCDNMEDVFVAFEMASLLGDLPHFDAEMARRRQACPGLPHTCPAQLSDCMAQTIAWVYNRATRASECARDGTPGTGYLSADVAHNLLAKAILPCGPSPTPAIISFNYDWLVDYALATNGARPRYHLHGLSVPQPRASSTAIPDQRRPVDLLKLHGSLTWAIAPLDVCCDREQVVHYEFGPERLTRDQRWVLATNENTLDVRDLIDHELTRCGRPTTSNTVIVPPTWDKSRYNRHLIRVWQKASVRLSAARHVYVFGFSMPNTDAFVKYLWAVSTLANGRPEDFWVFDKHADSAMAARYRNTLGLAASDSFRLFRASFDEAMSKIGGAAPDAEAKTFAARVHSAVETAHAFDEIMC